MSSETGTGFELMKKELELRLSRVKMSQDDFVAFLVKHRKEVLDVIVNSEVADPEKAETEEMT